VGALDVALAFAAVIVISMGYAHRLGNYGPDDEWGKLPSIMTERRAEAIHRALLRYHEHNGSYPDALPELTPRYMLYLPTPFMIPGQAWCYEGGGEHFQFGYVYREFFSSPASARTYAAAGEPVDTVWKCP
jgi:hypothetical protein